MRGRLHVPLPLDSVMVPAPYPYPHRVGVSVGVFLFWQKETGPGARTSHSRTVGLAALE